MCGYPSEAGSVTILASLIGLLAIMSVFSLRLETKPDRYSEIHFESHDPTGPETYVTLVAITSRIFGITTVSVTIYSDAASQYSLV